MSQRTQLSAIEFHRSRPHGIKCCVDTRAESLTRVPSIERRWTSWDIVKNSDPFKKSDAQTIEFLVQIPRDGEKTVNYKVHYSW